MIPAVEPIERSTRLSAAGRAALPAAFACLLLSWIAGGVVGLFAATAFAAVLLALFLGRLHVQGLGVVPPAPARAHVGDAFALRVSIENRSSTFSARHLRITSGERGAERLSGHCACVRPGERVRVPVEHRLLRRGRHRRVRLALTSAFPLGLIERRLVFELEVDLLALPRLGSLGDLRGLPRGRRADASFTRFLQRGDDELYGVRDWREGESLRRVHWRLSARRGRRIVREMRREEEPPVHLWLVAAVSDAVPFDRPRRSFERAVSLTATLAEHFLRTGRRVRLTLSGAEDRAIEPARGRAGLLGILTALAEAEREVGAPNAPGGPLDRAAAAAVGGRDRHDATIAVVVGDAEGAPLRRPGVVIFDVETREIEGVFLPGRPWGAAAPPALVGGASW